MKAVPRIRPLHLKLSLSKNIKMLFRNFPLAIISVLSLTQDSNQRNILHAHVSRRPAASCDKLWMISHHIVPDFRDIRSPEKFAHLSSDEAACKF